MRDRLKFLLSAILAIPALRLFGPGRALASNDLDLARKLNREGEKLVETGKYQQALEVFKEMLAACKGKDFGRAVATFYIGRCYLEIGDYDTSLKYLEEAEGIFARLNKLNEKAVATQTKARLYAEKSQVQSIARPIPGRGRSVHEIQGHRGVI